MPHFDHARILDELPQQPFEIFAVQARVFERNRKLDQQRAEFSLGGDRVQPFAGQRSSSSFGRMVAAEVGPTTAIGECVNDTIQLSGKDEIRIYSGRFAPTASPFPA